MSPDVFLSRQQIRYDGIGMPGTPAQIVDALIKLNATRIWNPDTKDFEYYVYSTADFISIGLNPSSFSPLWKAKENAAVMRYRDSLNTGDLAKVHYAVDQVNTIRQVTGTQMLTADPDFNILAHGNNYVGAVARWIVSDRMRVLEQSVSDPDTLPSWFDTKAAFDALNNYAEQGKQETLGL